MVVDVAILHSDVREGVRSRGLRVLGVLMVVLEAPEWEAGEMEVPTRDIDGTFERVFRIGIGGAEANLSRCCRGLSLSFGDIVDGRGGGSLANRSLGGVPGGTNLDVEIGNNEGEGVLNVGATWESEITCDWEGTDLRLRLRSAPCNEDLARSVDQIVVLALVVVEILVVLGLLSTLGGVGYPPEADGGVVGESRTLFWSGETRMEDCNCKLETLALAAHLPLEAIDGLRETESTN